MSSLSSSGTLIEAFDVFQTYNTNYGMQLGSTATTGDDRWFRLALSGASALVAGKLMQGPAYVANNIQLTPAAAAIGAVQVTVTLGGTAVTANQYAGGYLVVSLDSGGTPGYMYQISSHPAQASTTGTVVITLVDPLQVAISASAKIDLVSNAYMGIVVNPTTGTSNPTGVTVTPVAAATYFWLQVDGAAVVLNDAGGAITVGNDVTVSTSVAGAVKSLTGTLPTIGTAMTAGTASQYFTVNLSLF